MRRIGVVAVFLISAVPLRAAADDIPAAIVLRYDNATKACGVASYDKTIKAAPDLHVRWDILNQCSTDQMVSLTTFKKKSGPNNTADPDPNNPMTEKPPHSQTVAAGKTDSIRKQAKPHGASGTYKYKYTIEVGKVIIDPVLVIEKP